MSHREPLSLPLESSGLGDTSDGDATVFIRISGASRREPRRAAVDPTPYRPPPPPPAPPVSSMAPRPVGRLVAPPSLPSPPPPPTATVFRGPVPHTHPSSEAPPPTGSTRSARSPFHVSTPTPGPAERASTADSRFLATVVLCCTTVCVGMVATLLVAVGPGESVAADAKGPEYEPSGRELALGDDDTGSWGSDDPDDDLNSDPKPGWTGASGTTSTTSNPTPSTVDRPAPAPKGGTLTVHLPDPRGVTSVAVVCPSGFTARSTYGGTPHVLPGVPGESCTLWFRGASPYKYVGAVGGQSLTCSFGSNVAQCR